MHALSKFLFSLSYISLLVPSLAAPTEQSLNAKLDRRGYAIDPKGSMVYKPWPSGEVQYCLKDPSQRDAFRKVNDKAWRLWVDAFGGQSSLRIREVDCNTAPEGTLFITLTNEKRATTSMGYKPSGNIMEIDLASDWGTKDAAVNLAHEWGHAFGLYHEHQKISAWKPDDGSSPLLDLKCENLKDYDQKKKEGNDMKSLCTKWTAANGADFSAREMLPFTEPKEVYKSPDFDWNSIMLYSSTIGAKTTAGIQRHALVKYNGDYIKPNMVPSAGDVATIALLYPPVQQLPELEPLPATSWCNVHVTETSPSIANAMIPHVSVKIKDGQGKEVGHVENQDVSSQISVASELPHELLISVEGGVTMFNYDGRTWDTNNKDRCQVGGWDPREISNLQSSTRDMDCGFPC